MSDWFEIFFGFLQHYRYTQSQPYLDYLSSGLKIFAYQISFREDLDKSTWPDVEEKTG